MISALYHFDQYDDTSYLRSITLCDKNIKEKCLNKHIEEFSDNPRHKNKDAIVPQCTIAICKYDHQSLQVV